MLVIRRRAGEALLIGPNVQIEILEIGATQVKLGIIAPKEVLILRNEMHMTRQENEAAAREISTLVLGRLADRFRE